MCFEVCRSSTMFWLLVPEVFVSASINSEAVSTPFTTSPPLIQTRASTAEMGRLIGVAQLPILAVSYWPVVFAVDTLKASVNCGVSAHYSKNGKVRV